MGQQRLHRLVQAVAVGQLQAQAFGEVAGEDPGRLEPLQPRQGRLDLRHRAAEAFGRGGEVGAEIAGVVEQVDQVVADHPLDRIGRRRPRAAR